MERVYILSNQTLLLLNETSQFQNETVNITLLSSKFHLYRNHCENLSSSLSQEKQLIRNLSKHAVEKRKLEEEKRIQLSQLLYNVKNATSLNSTYLSLLQQRLQNSRVEFDSLNVKLIIETLKLEKENKKLLIEKHRAQVMGIKDDVNELKSLHQSLKLKKGCN